MQTPAAWETVKQFRLAAYRTLGLRKDSLFELMEAVLAAPGPATLVRLSLAAVFRRAWPSVSDALADGGVDTDACRRLVQSTRIEPPPERPVWAVDGTVWPRPSAGTSPERTYGHRTTAGMPQDGVVPAWEYEWLVAVPAPGTGWVLPLDVERRGPSDGTPTAVAIGMPRRALARRPSAAPRPVAALDSGYDPVQVARAELPLDVLVRLRSNRVFYRAPGPYQGRGAPRKDGDVFRLADPGTLGTPDASVTLADPACGRVQIDAWRDLRAKGAADAPCTVVRVELERLPRRAKPPAPLWLARPLVSDQRLPWERPLPTTQLTPGRVRRAFAGLFARLGTPARPPKPRGKAPGRRPGHAPGPRSRHPVTRRRPKRAA